MTMKYRAEKKKYQTQIMKKKKPSAKTEEKFVNEAFLSMRTGV